MQENHWKEIWEKRKTEKIFDDMTDKDKFVELKRLDGFDIFENGITYEAWNEHLKGIGEELCLRGGDSVFEVGCGSGANLFFFEQKGMDVGGIDYSSALVRIARKSIHPDRLKELVCGEADEMPALIEYDAVISYGVFYYFPDLEYAERVLDLMLKKAKNVIAVLDVHDIEKKDAYIAYRIKNTENYLERYKGLPKLHYPKNFFEDFAKKHNLKIKFTNSDLKGYWNNEFIFNCYMYK